MEPTLLDAPFEGRAALLSPFDRLVQDRKRLDQLFEFDYLLEMYKPVEQRIWGYYALPILTATGWSESSTPPRSRPRACSGSTRSTRTNPSTTRPSDAVAAEIEDLARWLDLEVMYVE